MPPVSENLLRGKRRDRTEVKDKVSLIHTHTARHLENWLREALPTLAQPWPGTNTTTTTTGKRNSFDGRCDFMALSLSFPQKRLALTPSGSDSELSIVFFYTAITTATTTANESSLQKAAAQTAADEKVSQCSAECTSAETQRSDTQDIHSENTHRRCGEKKLLKVASLRE